VCEPLAEVAGCRLTLKVETVNPIRSFKGRGADYAVARLVGHGPRAPLVCASAGNFGQGVAYACRKRGLAVTVFAALNASPLKIERMRALGADVRLAGDDLEAAKAIARAHAADRGAHFLEDGFDPALSEGAGTIALELFALGTTYDDLVIPLGDGSLLNGIARWAKAASPATRVLGVCSSGAPAMAHAWRRGPGAAPEPAPVSTIADGIAVRMPIATSLEDMRAHVDDVLEVDDASLIQAMRLVHTHAGLVTEPAGVAGLAAILARPGDFAGRDVVTVLCGGNLTAEQLAAYDLASTGRSSR
jgi:threonine dehydratase